MGIGMEERQKYYSLLQPPNLIYTHDFNISEVDHSRFEKVGRATGLDTDGGKRQGVFSPALLHFLLGRIRGRCSSEHFQKADVYTVVLILDPGLLVPLEVVVPSTVVVPSQTLRPLDESLLDESPRQLVTRTPRFSVPPFGDSPT